MDTSVLEARVATLEARIRGSASQPIGGSTLSQRVAKLEGGLDEKTRPELKELAEKLTKTKSLLSTDVITPPLSTASQWLLIESQMDLIKQAAQQLEEIEELTKYIEPPVINATGEQLIALEAAHARQCEQAGEGHRDLTRLAQTYRDVIHLLSERFVALDDLVSRAEKGKG